MRWLLAPFLAASLLSVTARAQSLPAPEVWFNPHTPVDMGSLWTDDAPWMTAASKVNVLVLVDWWVRDPANAAQTAQMIAFAQRHHMELALDVEPVQILTTDKCGAGEGYDRAGDIASAVKIIANLGGTLDWLEMDEPMWWGHYSPDPTKCQWGVPDVITRVVLSMSEGLAVFPHAKIIEIEPMPDVTQQTNWRQDVRSFQVALAQQLGSPVRSMMLDVGWEYPGWQQGMQDIRKYTSENGMGLCVILDGTELDASDSIWMADAINNIETLEGTLHIIPDQVQFTTWNTHPTNLLPETSPTALTWLINRYFRALTVLQAQFVGLGAHGKLTTSSGKPIPNVTINAFKPGVDFTKPLPVTVTTGTVPAGASKAVIIVRVNTECGGCNGLNDLLFGATQYQETSGGSVSASYSYPTKPQILNGVIIGGETVGGTVVTRLIAQPGQSFSTNSNVFTVTPGAQYQLTIPASTIGGLGWNGFIGIVWLGTNGEIARVMVPPGPGKALMSSAVTAQDGTFSLSKLPRSVDGPNPVTIEFDGAGGTYRSSVWTPLH